MKKYKDILGDGGSNIVGQVEEQQARLTARLSHVRHTVAVVSGKGGVGKSAVTANLAAALAQQGYAVGLLDADLNGPSLAKMVGARGQTLRVTEAGVEPAVTAQGLKLMSMDFLLPSDESPLTWDAPTQAESYTWRGSMEANALRELLTDTAWGALDFLLLDLPPGTDRLATVVSVLPSLSGAVIVTIPSEVSHLVVKKSVTAAKEAKVPILGLIENMAGYVCARCGSVGDLFHGPGGETLAAELAIPYLGAIPFDPRLARAADRGVPFVAAEPTSPAARSLLRITDRLLAAL
jgi:ATP-binding protein involved in chromosome partitioning